MTTADTFKELIITIYCPRRMTPVNPLNKVKFFTWYYFTNLAFGAKSPNRKREVHF